MNSCPACDKEFDTQGGVNQHYAAKKDENHSGSIAKETVSCEECGESDEIYPSRRKTGEDSSDKYFCSKPCRAAHYGREYENKETIVCENCGEKFNAPPSDNRMYCSNECRFNDYPEGPDHWAYNKVSINCDYCEKEFKRSPSDIRRKNNFCSTDCRNLWHSEKFVGKDHHRFIDGTSPNYGTNWKEQRNLARKRDYYTCRACGMSEEKHKELCGKELHVHHKIPRRYYNNMNKANKLFNLITLCASCHSQMESNIIEVTEIAE